MSDPGTRTKIQATGFGAIVTCAGYPGSVTLGEQGCATVTWYDAQDNRYRIAVTHTGGNGIKTNTLYYVNTEGEFAEIKDDDHSPASREYKSFHDWIGDK